MKYMKLDYKSRPSRRHASPGKFADYALGLFVRSKIHEGGSLAGKDSREASSTGSIFAPPLSSRSIGSGFGAPDSGLSRFFLFAPGWLIAVFLCDIVPGRFAASLFFPKRRPISLAARIFRLSGRV
jgi:hypothetical protein